MDFLKIQDVYILLAGFDVFLNLLRSRNHIKMKKKIICILKFSKNPFRKLLIVVLVRYTK